MHIDFVQALRDIEKEKDIPLSVLGEIIEAALVSAYKRHYGAASEIHVEIDWNESRAAVYTRKLVVEEVENPHLEMSLAEARALDPEVQAGECMDLEVTPEDFGRIAAQTAKQVVLQRIREAERDIVFEAFRERAGEVVTGLVQRREGRSVYLTIGKAEALLPASEQIPTDAYRFNERLKLYLLEVKQTTKGPRVLVSRSHPGLLRRLFELEVPEIHDSVVEVKNVAREPGARSKVAVASRQENVDPVGACVGHRGSRVQAVVEELRGEKIDIVRWSDSSARYIASALSPAKVAEVRLHETERSAIVIVAENQLSLAIGREGQNVRLASRLTDWRLDIRSEAQMRQLEQERAQAAAAQAELAAAGEAAPAAEPVPPALAAGDLAAAASPQPNDGSELTPAGPLAAEQPETEQVLP